MGPLETRELVALHLADAWEGNTQAPPHAASTPGISEVLGVGETVSARIELLSVLSGMSEDGLVRERQGTVRNLQGERNYYELTEAGRDLARRTTDGLEGAQTYVTRGLDAGDGEPSTERCELLERLGWTHLYLGDRDDALEAFEREAELAEVVDDDEKRAKGLNGRASVAFMAGNVDEGIERMLAAIEHLEDTGNEEYLVTAHSNLGVMLLRVGDVTEARARFERGLELGRDLGNRVIENLCLGNLALARQRLGDWEAALETYERAMTLAERLDRAQTVGFVLGHRAEILLERGAFDRARADLERGLEVNQEIEHMRQEAMVRTRLAKLAVSTGDLETATDHAEATVDLAEAAEPQWVAEATVRLGDVARARNDLGTAIERYRSAAEHARTASSARTTATAHCRAATVLYRQGRPEAAGDHVETALDSAGDADEPLLWARCRMAEARRCRHDGRHDEVERALNAAEERIDGLEARLTRFRILTERGRLARDRSRPGAARRHLGRVLENGSRIGATEIEREATGALETLPEAGDADPG